MCVGVCVGVCVKVRGTILVSSGTQYYVKGCVNGSLLSSKYPAQVSCSSVLLYIYIYVFKLSFSLGKNYLFTYLLACVAVL